jgi:hypothetical protein
MISKAELVNRRGRRTLVEVLYSHDQSGPVHRLTTWNRLNAEVGLRALVLMESLGDRLAMDTECGV